MANGKFMLGYITRHGVLRPNATGCVTTCYVLYDIFAIIGIGMQLAIDYGISNPEAKVHIPGIKYVIIWIGAFAGALPANTYVHDGIRRGIQFVGQNIKHRSLLVIVMLNVIFVGVAVFSVASKLKLLASPISCFAQMDTYLKLHSDSAPPVIITVFLSNPEIAFEAASNLPGHPLSKLHHLIVRPHVLICDFCLLMASDVIISIIGNVIIAVILAQTIRIVQPRPWHFLCCFRRKSVPVPNPNDVENGQKEAKKSKLSRAISNNPPVRELTVSVVQVTHSQASEPLQQPNFDLLRNWAQRRTAQDDVIQHHLDLDSALDPHLKKKKISKWTA
ncbi:hypothetical protein H4Q26_014025 [Puccinia striiformis f. sp. tritici PST-130]|nr:hypothetical protein H4Q26_014025 [Puccinia striiformis f. sp. tritici PST-130]